MNERATANPTRRGSRQPRRDEMRQRSLGQQGPQDPRIIKPGHPDSPSRPREGERLKAKGQRSKTKSSYLKPVACSLKPSQKGQETELTIFPIQLLSCGGRERRTPLESKEDSANAVGIAPMA